MGAVVGLAGKQSLQLPLAAALVCCSGLLLFHLVHLSYHPGPTISRRVFSLPSNFPVTFSDRNLMAPSQCCLSWTDLSSNVFNWITLSISAALSSHRCLPMAVSTTAAFN